MVYVCEACAYESKTKGNLLKHFTTKKHTENTDENIVKKVKIDNSNKTYDCACCKKVFKHRQSLYSHKKKYCAQIKEIIIKENKALKKETDALKKKISKKNDDQIIKENNALKKIIIKKETEQMDKELKQLEQDTKKIKQDTQKTKTCIAKSNEMLSGVYLVQPGTLIDTDRYKFGMSINVKQRTSSYNTDTRILSKYYTPYENLFEDNLKILYKKQVYTGNEYIKFNNKKEMIEMFTNNVNKTRIVLDCIKKYIKKQMIKRRQIKVIDTDKEEIEEIEDNDTITYNYSCVRCGYGTNTSQCYIRHIKRKVICEAIVSDVSFEGEYDKHIKLRDEITENKKSKEQEQHIFKCEYCEKVLSTKQVCDNHMEKCKYKNKQPDENIMKMEQQIKQLQQQIQEKKLMNKTIKLVAYDSVSTCVLSQEEILQCMEHKNLCIVEIIRMIYFNDKKPENTCILLEEPASKFIKVFDGNKWILKFKEEILTDLINKNTQYLFKILKNMKKINKEERHIFSKYVNDINDEDTKDHIVMTLYNNRDKVSIVL
jgi:hypothetical protein